MTIQYPYEKLIPSERFREHIHFEFDKCIACERFCECIHFEFDKCIACEVCVHVWPINLFVVDWKLRNHKRKKQLKVIVLIPEFVSSTKIVSTIVPQIVYR